MGCVDSANRHRHARISRGWRTFMVDVLGVGESAGPAGANGDTLYLKMDDRTWRIAVHPRRATKSSRTRAGSVRRARRRSTTTVDASAALGGQGRPGTDALRGRARRAGRRAVRRPVRQSPRVVLRRRSIDEFVFVPPQRRLGLRHRRCRPRPRALRRAVVQRRARLLRPRHGLQGHRQVLVGPQRRRVHALDAAPPQPRVHRPAAPGRAGPQPLHDRGEDARRRRTGLRPRDGRAASTSSTRSASTATTRCSRSTCRAPSGFNVELGWKGMMVDDSNWTVRTYTGRGEMWGHRGMFMETSRTTKVD